MKRLVHYFLVLILCGGYVLVSASPAAANCHDVTITANPNPVTEANTDVTVTIHRVIRETGCTANINYMTEDGSATEPEDYKRVPTGHCSEFDTGPLASTTADCTFKVTIKDDPVYEGDQTFKVSFTGTSNAPVSDSTTVTIRDNEQSPTPTPRRTTTQPPSPTTSPSVSPTATKPGPSASPGSPLVLPGEGTPKATPTGNIRAQGDQKKGAPVGLIVGIVALVIAGGAGVGLWLLRRTPA